MAIPLRPKTRHHSPVDSSSVNKTAIAILPLPPSRHFFLGFFAA